MMMDDARAAVVSPDRTNTRNETLHHLWNMHQAGLFSREEVRNMVFKEMGVCPPAPTPAAPMTPPTVMRPAAPKPVQLRVAVTDDRIIARTVFPVPSPKRKKNKDKKKRKKKAVDHVSNLRDIVKNVARKRFFDQCCIKGAYWL